MASLIAASGHPRPDSNGPHQPFAFMVASAPPAPPAPATRFFGRYELRRLLGKASGTMAWLAFDPRMDQEVMLTMPRVQPADAAGLDHWLRDVRMAARLNHPHLAHVIDVGTQDHWPFIAVDRALGVTLGEWVKAHPATPPIEVVPWLRQALDGLAFAHEAGIAHLDPQLHSILISEQGTVRLMALAVAGDAARRAADSARDGAHARAMSVDTNQLRAQRDAAQRDLLAFGVLTHQLLTGQAVLDEPDTARVIERMPPLGRDLVRLPWSTPHPIPEALRAIANRATAGQERLRYHNARTLTRALGGWLEVQAQERGGPLALLLDRLHSVGHLPAGAGATARVARLAAFDGQRNDELAAQILQDVALSLEILRTVNAAQVQVTQVGGAGPVLTIRRAIALVGVNGVRNAARGLRAWPGPLSEPHAAALQTQMDRARLAGHVAQALRPAGYDPEVVYLVAVLQNLGRLLVQYHFPDESEQIRQLMQTAPAAAASTDGSKPAEQPGMREDGAAFAVLGVDIESLGVAVVRHWGLGDDVLQMARRMPTDKPVRTPDTDIESLRVTASAANEAVDVITQLPAARMVAGMTTVAQRYARVLGIGMKELQEALQAARVALSSGGVAESGSREGDAEQGADPADPRESVPAGVTAPIGLQRG
jgi:eukaryotic-like serine/threonine-protein kinase